VGRRSQRPQHGRPLKPHRPLRHQALRC
jgi:hypothetical protein